MSLVGPFRQFSRRAPDWLLATGSRLLSAVLWSYIHTMNRAAIAVGLSLPLRDYLGMLARLRFRDVESVVYDQLAPQIARYPARTQVLEWVGCAGGVVDRLTTGRATAGSAISGSRALRTGRPFQWPLSLQMDTETGSARQGAHYDQILDEYDAHYGDALSRE